MDGPDPVMAGRKMEDLARVAAAAYIAEFAYELSASPLSPEEFQRSRDHLDDWWDRLAALDRGEAEPELTDGIGAVHPAAATPSQVVIGSSVDEAGADESHIQENVDEARIDGTVAEPGPAAEIAGTESEPVVDDVPAGSPAPLEPDPVLETATTVWDTAAEEGVVEPRQRSNWFSGRDMWRAANLLLLRLPVTRADELRTELATTVGLETWNPDRILVPGYADSGEIALDAQHGVVREARRPVESTQVHPSWKEHRKLLSRLGNVLVLLELEGEHLRTLYHLLGDGKVQLVKPARVPKQDSSGNGEFEDKSIGYFRNQVEAALAGEADAGGLRTVLELTLSVVSNPVPHRDSWWAKNANHAVADATEALADRGVQVEGLISNPANGSSELVLRLPRPKWATQRYTLLWTLMPNTKAGDDVLPGRGIYASS